MKSIFCSLILLFIFFHFTFGATLQGTLKNTDSLLPVANARITVTAMDSLKEDRLTYSSFSDEDGEYIIENIPVGQFDVYCVHAAYDFYSTFITFIEETDVVELSIDLYPKSTPPADSGYATLQGMVMDSLTLLPVYPAEINLYLDGDSTKYSTMNNPDGSYILENIDPGSYYLTCSAENYQPVYNIVRDLVPGINQYDFMLESLEPVERGSLSGTVVFDDTGDPVCRAYIEIIPADGLEILYSTYTDYDGSYSAKIQAGEYIVMCQYFIYTNGDSMNSECVDLYYYTEYYDNVLDITDATPVWVYPEENTTDINFGIPAPSIPGTVTISGKVIDNEGNPLESAKVQLSIPLWDTKLDTIVIPFAYTDQNGEYLLSFNNFYRIPYGIVHAEKKGYYIEYYQEKSEFYEADLISLADSMITNIDFSLDIIDDTGSCSISGRIYSDSGEVILGATVIGVKEFELELFTTFSDSTGYYCFNNLKPGTYYLMYVANGFMYEFYDNVATWEEATPIELKGELTGIDAVLTSLDPADLINRIITGKVTDLSDLPLSGTVVGIYDMAGEALGYGITNETGDYQVLIKDVNQLNMCATKISYRSERLDIQSGAEKRKIVNFVLSKLSPSGVTGEEIYPFDFKLDSPYPNPFNPNTTISFSIPKAQAVKISVYNILGQLVKILLDKEMQAGKHQITWDGRDTKGILVATGIYFLSLEAKDKRLFRKMILAK
jgi:hypothetical protein